MKWTANHAKKQRTGRYFIGTIDLFTGDLSQAVEPNHAVSDSSPGRRGRHEDLLPARVDHGRNYLSISGAAAQHASDGIHYFLLVW